MPTIINQFLLKSAIRRIGLAVIQVSVTAYTLSYSIAYKINDDAIYNLYNGQAEIVQLLVLL